MGSDLWAVYAHTVTMDCDAPCIARAVMEQRYASIYAPSRYGSLGAHSAGSIRSIWYCHYWAESIELTVSRVWSTTEYISHETIANAGGGALSIWGGDRRFFQGENLFYTSYINNKLLFQNLHVNTWQICDINLIRKKYGKLLGSVYRIFNKLPHNYEKFSMTCQPWGNLFAASNLQTWRCSCRFRDKLASPCIPIWRKLSMGEGGEWLWTARPRYAPLWETPFSRALYWPFEI